METKATGTLLEDAERYARTSLEIFRLKLVAQSANVVSTLTSKLTIIVIVAFFSFFLSFGLSLYIGSFFVQTYYGFFIVAVFYLVISLILIANKGRIIKRPVQNQIISTLLKEINNRTDKNTER